MSVATSGTILPFIPGCRFAHPGYASLFHTLNIVSPSISSTRKITTKT
jgi:hypothetical protein